MKSKTDITAEQSREFLEEIAILKSANVDFDKLKTWEGFWEEGTRLRKLGVLKSGICGASCPDCYKQSPNDTNEYSDNWCHCEKQEIIPHTEIVLALGGPADYRVNKSSERPM